MLRLKWDFQSDFNEPLILLKVEELVNGRLFSRKAILCYFHTECGCYKYVPMDTNYIVLHMEPIGEFIARSHIIIS